MGDGRYYSAHQFISTALLILLTTLTVSLTVYSYYRRKSADGGKMITAALSTAVFFAFVRLLETVYPGPIAPFVLRYASCVATLSVFLTLGFFFAVFINPIFKHPPHKWQTGCGHAVLIVLPVTFFSAAGILTSGGLLIDSYDYFSPEYATAYMLAPAAIACASMTAFFFSLLSGRRFATTPRKTALFITAYFILTLLLYVTAIIIKFQFIDYVEYAVHVACAFLCLAVIYNSAPFGFSARVFDKLGDMLTDLVFVTDKDGMIIYKNARARSAPFVADTQHLDIADLTGVFQGPAAVQSDAYGNRYIQITRDNRQLCFTYQHKPLENGTEMLGHIVTFTDITRLIELAGKLEIEQKHAEATNSRLHHYSHVVYHVEKERHVSSLLEEILAAREKSIQLLITKIHELGLTADDSAFEKRLDETLELSKDILSEVRQTVTAYRDYYGG